MSGDLIEFSKVTHQFKNIDHFVDIFLKLKTIQTHTLQFVCLPVENATTLSDLCLSKRDDNKVVH